jgi:1-deoxy-D-xylulose-5-phosphate reductoisomerase
MTARTAPQTISILGATGSIGLNTLDLIGRMPERYVVGAVTANANASDLAELAKQHGARFAAVADPAAYTTLKAALAGTGIEAAAGPESLIEAATRPADRVMAAIVGAAGLAPTLSAVRRGTTILLANKECLVTAGRLFMETARASGATVLPVDSEHSAVFQALDTTQKDSVERVTLTASGGPFRTWSGEQLARARPEEAVRHPNWLMGAKISIDSATLMNKGLELIEAHHLFDIEAARLDVLVHPESIVHGFVAYRDGSVVAQLAVPDMRTPIAYSLAWPERIEAPTPRLDLAALGKLTFEKPDLDRFPALGLAMRALEIGGGAATVLNAANEIAVKFYLQERIRFPEIALIVENVLDKHARDGGVEPTSLDEALALDRWARDVARTVVPEQLDRAG